MRVAQLEDVGALVRSRPARAGGTRVVAIDGPSGSGKTTLGRRLRRVLGCRSVHVDAIYPGWDGLAETPALLVEHILEPLADGRRAAYRRWQWPRGDGADDSASAGHWAEEHVVRPDPVLLVEGVGSGALVCAPYLAVLLFVDAPRDERRRRGVARDGDVYAPHWERWAAQEQTLFASDRPRERADLVVDGAPRLPHDPDRELVLLDR